MTQLERRPKKKKEDDLKKIKMEDDLKKKLLEDDLKKKWKLKTTLIFFLLERRPQKNRRRPETKNGRRPQKNGSRPQKMEDSQIIFF